MMYQEFYAEIRKLLHAVADIDGAMTQKEKSKLVDIIKKELGEEIKDRQEINPGMSFLSKPGFNSPCNRVDAEQAFISYIHFVETYCSTFDERMKKVTMYVAKGIAKAYWKTNEDESSQQFNTQEADNYWLGRAKRSFSDITPWVVSIT